MTKILMVCLGNICRSPLAEGILRAKLPKDNFVVDSAGTSNYHVGDRPDSRSIDIAYKYGINIENLKGRQFKTSDFSEFDLIYVMDNSNFQDVIALAHNDDDIAKVKFILDELSPNSKLDVPDPYYGGRSGFENVYQLLDKACQIVANKLV